MMAHLIYTYKKLCVQFGYAYQKSFGQQVCNKTTCLTISILAFFQTFILFTSQTYQAEYYDYTFTTCIFPSHIMFAMYTTYICFL